MAGRINDEDVVTVRERARIDEVIGSYVALRNAGGGSLKGLCPFHDEKTPSFQVTPSRGFYYCFGCGEGGDVITFMQKIDNLSFAESIERLADRVGIQLRYTEDAGPRPEPGLRSRLMEAHRAAAEFFAEQLSTPDALAGRQFLAASAGSTAPPRSCSASASPRGADGCWPQHLRGRGFSDKELVAGGLVRESGYDFFQSRLLWPIRDSGQQVIGFGARRLFDDDRMPAKYLNTPETPLYKKSHVLYGLDLARKPIGHKSQAVVVEGYTDVMAAHLSGVDTAIASCGTAFGDDHARLLRRLMGDHDAFRGEVIFTFDGDAAGPGRRAQGVQRRPELPRPDLRGHRADRPGPVRPAAAARRGGRPRAGGSPGAAVPLRDDATCSSQHDLDRADGRLAALRAAAPLVASIRDASLVTGYARELAGLLGMDVEEVRSEVVARGQPLPPHRFRAGGRPRRQPDRDGELALPDPADRTSPPSVSR